MRKRDFEIINNINKKPISVNDLRPFLIDRTLLYGYTCDRKTFHVYLKDLEIHTVTYDVDYSGDKPSPKNMTEINILSNTDYVPDKRLYPEACDFNFCLLLKNKGISLPFTVFDEKRPETDFYGFTLDDV